MFPHECRGRNHAMAKPARGGKETTGGGEARRGKRVTFDAATWQALDLLARDSMRDFQELADEAFADLLEKHERPTDLKSALRRSAAEKKAPAHSPARPKSRRR